MVLVRPDEVNFLASPWRSSTPGLYLQILMLLHTFTVHQVTALALQDRLPSIFPPADDEAFNPTYILFYVSAEVSSLSFGRPSHNWVLIPTSRDRRLTPPRHSKWTSPIDIILYKGVHFLIPQRTLLGLRQRLDHTIFAVTFSLSSRLFPYT